MMSFKENIRTNTKAWLLTLFAGLLYGPMLFEYFVMLCDKSYYSYTVALLPVIVVIFCYRWRVAGPANTFASRWIIWLMIFLSVPVTLFAFLYYIPWLAVLAWLMLMAALALHLSSQREVDNILGIYLLLLFILRPPYQMVLRVINWMESLSSEPASMILDHNNVIHTIQGGILSLSEQEYEIEAICSGWVSLLSIVATAAVVCVLRNRPFLHTAVVLLLAVVCTWVLNVFRILVVVFVSQKFEIDLLSGVYQIGYVLLSFLAALILVISADALAEFCFAAIKVNRSSEAGSHKSKSWSVRLWNGLFCFKLADFISRYRLRKRAPDAGSVVWAAMFCAMAGLIVLEGVVYFNRSKARGTQSIYSESELSKLTKDSIIFDRPGWKMIDYSEEKRDYSSIWGAFSSTWKLKYSGVIVVMSLDYPFDDWHDVKSCYSRIGWEITGEKIVKNPSFNDWAISETRLVLPNGDTGFVLCSHCDHIGNTVDPKPVSHRWEMLRYRLHPDRWTAPFGKSLDKDRQTYYQTQCMVATPMPLDQATQQEIRLMYHSFREQARKAIARRSRKNSE